MKFTFEEAELINNLFEDSKDTTSKELIINRLNQLKLNTEESELIEIINTTIKKISNISNDLYVKIINDLPIDTNTAY